MTKATSAALATDGGSGQGAVLASEGFSASVCSPSTETCTTSCLFVVFSGGPVGATSRITMGCTSGAVGDGLASFSIRTFGDGRIAAEASAGGPHQGHDPATTSSAITDG